MHEMRAAEFFALPGVIMWPHDMTMKIQSRKCPDANIAGTTAPDAVRSL